MREETTGSDRGALDRKLTTAAWVLFFAMWGGTLLVERSTQIDLRNLQYVAAGVILLGLNGARYLKDIPMSRLTLVIGLLAVVGGALRQSLGEVSVIAMVLATLGSVALAEGILRLAGGESAPKGKLGRRNG